MLDKFNFHSLKNISTNALLPLPWFHEIYQQNFRQMLRNICHHQHLWARLWIKWSTKVPILIYLYVEIIDGDSYLYTSFFWLGYKQFNISVCLYASICFWRKYFLCFWILMMAEETTWSANQTIILCSQGHQHTTNRKSPFDDDNINVSSSILKCFLLVLKNNQSIG